MAKGKKCDTCGRERDDVRRYSAYSPVTGRHTAYDLCGDCVRSHIVFARSSRKQLRRWEVSDD